MLGILVGRGAGRLAHRIAKRSRGVRPLFTLALQVSRQHSFPSAEEKRPKQLTTLASPMLIVSSASYSSPSCLKNFPVLRVFLSCLRSSLSETVSASEDTVTHQHGATFYVLMYEELLGIEPCLMCRCKDKDGGRGSTGHATLLFCFIVCLGVS